MSENSNNYFPEMANPKFKKFGSCKERSPSGFYSIGVKAKAQ